MNRLIAIPALALAATTLLSGCESMGNRHYDYRVMKVQHQPNSALEIVTANGSIRALQENRENVAVEVELFGYDAERLDFATVHADRMGDNTLRVWVEWPGGKRRDGEGAKVEVFLPDAQGVTAKTSNGSVVIMGLAGDAIVKTSNGSVHLDKHNGKMDLATSNGAIRVDDSSGEIFFDTSNGRILVSNADGLVQGDTSNGNVFVSTAEGASGPIRIRTTNGRVELDLGQSYEGVFRVKTTNGRIKTANLPDARLVESSNHTLELQMGDSEVISEVRTTNGSVRVHGDAKD